MIATAKAGAKPDDVAILDRQGAGLPEPCVIRPSRPTAISGGRIARRPGAVSAKERRAVDAIIRRWLPR